jgi:hypothetical protein
VHERSFSRHTTKRNAYLWYYSNGRLNNVWLGQDLDHDGIMWSLRGYEYGGESYFESDPYGDNIFNMNKFNPVDGTWAPISECPFAFYDTDGNGYFDQWEVYREGSGVPVSVTSVRDEKARRVEFKQDKLSAFYVNEVLPKAKAANEKFMAAMSGLRPFAVPEGLKAAMASGPENYRRYAQDVTRELQYEDFLDYFGKQANAILLADSKDKSGKEFAGNLRWLKRGATPDVLETTPNSHTAWELASLLERLDLAYGQGDLDNAAAAAQEIKKLGIFK